MGLLRSWRIIAVGFAIGIGLGITFAGYDFSKVIAQNKYAYFRNCAAARAAGAAPIREGQPGYRVELDADRDGIACEPYSGN